MPGIGAFERAAAMGGALRLSAGDPNRLEAYGTGCLSGRMVVWMKGTGRGAEASNRAVTQNFLDAVRNAYGDAYALSVSRNLDLSGRTPLRARQVRQIIDAGEAAVTSGGQRNKAVADRFLSDRSPRFAGSFGALFRTAAMGAGLGDRGLVFYETSKLEREIRKDIMAEGRGGRVQVTDERARELANVRIGNFVRKKAELMTRIDQMEGPSPLQKELMKDFARTHEISDPEAITQLWRMRSASADLFRALGDPSKTRAEKMSALVAFSRDYEEALSVLKARVEGSGGEFGADDLMTFPADALEMGAILGGFSSEEMGRVFSELSSPGMKEMRDGMEAIYNSNEALQLEVATGPRLKALNDVIGAAVGIAGRRGLQDREDISNAQRVSQNFTSPDSVPRGVMADLRSAGFPDINYSFEKQLAEMEPGPNRVAVKEALDMLQSHKGILGERDTPGYAGRLMTQMNRLIAQRERIQGLDIDPALKRKLLTRYENIIVHGLQGLREAEGSERSRAKPGDPPRPSLSDWSRDAKALVERMRGQPLAVARHGDILRDLSLSYDAQITPS